MLIRPNTCPICQRALKADVLQCPTCGCTVQFTTELPLFSRRDVIEALVAPTIKLTRERLTRNPRQGLAHYLLGLCYLNLSFIDRGTAEFQNALQFLPENHQIRFELAMVQLVQGKHASALDQIKQARELDPDNNNYLYMEHFLSGRGAQARGHIEGAIWHWIAAYEVSRRSTLAADELRVFVAMHEAKLAHMTGAQLAAIDPRDADFLRILNTDPRSREMTLPTIPPYPGEPGRMSMGVLRTLMPGMASRLEELHEQRVREYNMATQRREERRKEAIGQLKADIASWRDEVKQIRGNLGLMARLCLAVLEQEEEQHVNGNALTNGLSRGKPG